LVIITTPIGEAATASSTSWVIITTVFVELAPWMFHHRILQGWHG